MRARSVVVTLAAAAALVAAPVVPAGAGVNHSINVTPTEAKPGDTLTVSGTSDCASVAYTVTLTYTNPDGDPATATATGTSDASGEYVQAITVPETAVAKEVATVSSSLECSGGAAPSNTVNVAIAAHEGTLTATPPRGEAGTVVTIHGTNCYGGDVEVVFGDGDSFDFAIAVEDVTLHPDKTFDGTFTIPDGVPPGDHVFAAGCPGTDYPFAPFTLVASDDEETDPPAGPPAAPPAVPVVDTPTFTG